MMNSLELSESAAGILLPVQAHAGARRNGITGVHDGRLKISVTQAPEKGKANRVLQETIADAFDLSRSQVTLISGASSARKVFCLSGVSLEEIRQCHHQIMLDLSRGSMIRDE